MKLFKNRAELILLTLAMLFVLSSHAQNKFLHQLEIKGGYLFDQDDQRIPYLEEEFGDAFRLNYQGIKYVAFGYTASHGKTTFGMEVDYFKYGKLRPENDNIFRQIIPPGRYKQQLQFAIFYGKSIFNTEKINLFIAPMAGIAFRTNTLFGTFQFDIDAPVQDFVIGLGGKLQANFKLTDRLGISLGSKLMILDYYVRNVGKSIETSDHFDFIRGDAVVQLGLVFNL